MTKLIKTPVVTQGGTYEANKGEVKQTRKPGEKTASRSQQKRLNKQTKEEK